MEEIIQLLRENNMMLKYICGYILKVDNPQYRQAEDLKNLTTNLVSDFYTNNALGRNNI